MGATLRLEMSALVDQFIQAAVVPRHGGHGSGSLREADALRGAHPEVEISNIFAAAVLGDAQAVQQFISRDDRSASHPGGPYNWDPLTHLCFSRYLRVAPDSGRFVAAARALLEAGANANTGFFEEQHQPRPEFESVLYGAAGVAHHPELTKLLLEYGANPNDVEVAYHSPETYDNRVLEHLIHSGKLSPDSLATMLLRKCDWHDYNGIQLLLGSGADPNRFTGWGKTALQQALLRDNSLQSIDLLLDHGADPNLSQRGIASASALAARRGRADALQSFRRRQLHVELTPLERLAASCSLNDRDSIRRIVAADSGTIDELRADAGTFLAEFAGNDNSTGIERLLELGLDIRAPYKGDGYYAIAPNSTALHVAAWRLRPRTLKILIDHGASVNSLNASGETPLQLAIRASVDSYWKERRSPEIIRTLLEAGASADTIEIPSGYPEADVLLKPSKQDSGPA